MAAIGVGLALRRERGTAAFDFSGGSLPPGAVLRRASSAWRFDAAGLLVSEPADRARFDHDPASGRSRGVLIEGEASNLALHSGAFGEAVWTHNGGPPTPAAVAAPDGSLAASVLADGNASGFVSMAQGVPGSTALVGSVFVRKDAIGADVRYAMLRMTPPLSDVRFDTLTGAFAGSGGCGVIDAGGYWRVWRTVAAGATSVSLFPAVGTGGLGGSNAVAATGGITAWGMQVEAGSEPSSYVPSGAVAGMRAADSLRLDWGMRGVADGMVAVRYRFDDGSHQLATMAVTGGIGEVPTTLARRHVMRVERV